MPCGPPKLRHPDRAGLHMRVVLRGGVVIGPGRADLLQGIADQGSIAAAGRAMGMSYRRAWTLLNETSAEFGAPLVVAAPGGTRGGGAQVTELGHAVLSLYRRIEALAARAVASELDQLAVLTAGGARAVSRADPHPPAPHQEPRSAPPSRTARAR